MGILQKHFPHQWRYCGNFSFIIGSRNPDFVNIDGRKQVIELYGDYWHKGESGEERINHFKEYGFDCLIIWESELGNEEKVRQKVLTIG